MKTKSQRGRMSKDKGKVGEREVAALLRTHGFEARRGQQFAGGVDSPDVIHDIPGLHIEVKRTEALRLYAALAQAREEGYKQDVPVVFHRKNNEEWVVILPAHDFLDLIEELHDG